MSIRENVWEDGMFFYWSRIGDYEYEYTSDESGNCRFTGWCRWLGSKNREWNNYTGEERHR